MDGYTDRDGFAHDHAPKDRSTRKRCPGCKAAAARVAAIHAAEDKAAAARAAAAESIRLAPVRASEYSVPREPVRRFELEGRSFAVLEIPALPGRYETMAFRVCAKHEALPAMWERIGDLLDSSGEAADQVAYSYLHPTLLEGD